ncbi:MAG: signal recognition particle protein, partial [Phycisphaerae bacterium]|nr:signal recognition particle protein [Phycisphaerae bacterium]
SLHPGQVMVKIVNDELTSLMGPVDSRIYFVSPGPTVIMLAGLQGSGKTTTAAKLAKYVMAQGKKPLLVAADLQRPAAVDQLEILAQQIKVPAYCDRRSKDAVTLCRSAVNRASSTGQDVVILDTAGRLHIDADLMAELRNIVKVVNPQQIYLVCDAMTGQDAVNSAKEFNDQLELDGVILSKMDGDARGGAALSIKAVTGKPIKFIGVGEKLDRLEEFHPDRMAGRILGMGDVVSLVEKAQEHFDAEEAEKMQEKLLSDRFTMDDLLKQLQAIRKMGPLGDVLKMLPGMGSQMKNMPALDERELDRTQAIVQSMTKAERDDPEMVDASRRRRIAGGSGSEPSDVAELIKTFGRMRHMVKSFSGQGLFGGKGMFGKMKMAKQLSSMDLFSGQAQFKRKQRSKRKKSSRKRHRR